MICSIFMSVCQYIVCNLGFLDLAAVCVGFIPTFDIKCSPAPLGELGGRETCRYRSIDHCLDPGFLHVMQPLWYFLFFFMGWDWVHLVLRPLFGLLYQPQMIYDGDCRAVGGMWIGGGNPKYWEKTYSCAILSITNPIWLDLGSNPGRRDGKPATNRLSYGTASNLVLSGCYRVTIASLVGCLYVWSVTCCLRHLWCSSERYHILFSTHNVNQNEVIFVHMLIV
jgi:hypothetical protein